MFIATVGHRFLRYPDGRVLGMLNNRQSRLLQRLALSHLETLEPEVCQVVSAGIIGFDLIAVQAAHHAGIPYSFALPYPDHHRRLPRGWRVIMDELIADAEEVTFVSRGRAPKGMIQKCLFRLIERSDRILAYCEINKSRYAEQMMLYAYSRRKHVDNLWHRFHANQRE